MNLFYIQTGMKIGHAVPINLHCRIEMHTAVVVSVHRMSSFLHVSSSMMPKVYVLHVCRKSMLSLQLQASHCPWCISVDFLF